MSSYTFRWPHPANEVHLTGTFDNWGKTINLEKRGDYFETTIALPSTGKILYKWYVDNKWVCDPDVQTEADHEGNLNNVLYTHDIDSSAAPHVSSVAPGASTLAMAGQQPLTAAEKDTPGAFPLTPDVGEQTFSVNPIPASEGFGNPVTLAPGQAVPPSSTINNNTINSGVHDDPELKRAAGSQEQNFTVAPLPATGTAGNPVNLAPGEPVPDASTLTGHTTTSNVKLDEESYNKPDTVLPVLPIVGAGAAGATAGTAFLGGPGPQTTNLIPESSMGMGSDASIEASPFISSGTGGSTTANLAGQVPLETRGVPEVVSESQQEAQVSPEAAANQEAVAEKKQVEQELQQNVSEAPVTSDATHKESTDKSGGISGAVAGGVATAGAAAVGAGVLAREKVKSTTGKDPVAALPTSVQDKIEDINAKADSGAPRSTGEPIPTAVVESQKAAHVSAEASANPLAVQEKQAVENELKSKIPEVETSGAPAPTISAATSATAPASSSGAPQLAPVAGVAPITIESQGLNAPASSQAIPPTSAPSAVVTPTNKPETTKSSEPTVTTGVTSSKVPTQSTPVTPRSSNKDATKRSSFFGGSTSPGSASTSDKKEKRKSLLQRIKDKVRHHHDSSS